MKIVKEIVETEDKPSHKIKQLRKLMKKYDLQKEEEKKERMERLALRVYGAGMRALM
jgi:hypothetical protein